MPQLEVTRSPRASVSLEMRTHLVSSQQLLHGKWARRADTMASSLFERLWALLVWFLWTSGPIYLYPCTPCTWSHSLTPDSKTTPSGFFPISDCRLTARVRHIPYRAWSIPTRTLQVSSHFEGEELHYLNTAYSQDLKGKVQAQVPISYSLRTVSVTTHMMSSQPLQAVCPRHRNKHLLQ